MLAAGILAMVLLDGAGTGTAAEPFASALMAPGPAEKGGAADLYAPLLGDWAVEGPPLVRPVVCASNRPSATCPIDSRP